MLLPAGAPPTIVMTPKPILAVCVSAGGGALGALHGASPEEEEGVRDGAATAWRA